jgi:hypothetical protein
MAIFTGTTTVYGMAGATGIGKFNREDLSDLITNIDPTETPFISGIGKATANAVLHEWMQDTLAAAANNANIEGNEITFTAAGSGTRVSNRTQIHVKSIIISGTQDIVNKAGKGRELAYQVAKQTKEIARDLEFGALNNTQSVTGGATTARQMEGVAGWIATNQTDNLGTNTVTQSQIDTLAKQAWDDGGRPDKLFVGSYNKTVISGFTTGVTKNLDARDRRFVHAVDVYESDFNVLKVIPDHFTVADEVYAIQSDLWRLAYLRPLKLHDLAKTGDAEKRALIMEVTLECLAEYGNASIINTTTS